MKKLIIIVLTTLLLSSCVDKNICQDCGEYGCFYRAVELRMEGQEPTDENLYNAVWDEADKRCLEDSDVEMLMLEYQL